MDKRIVDLFTEESKIVFANGNVFNGAGEVSVYVGRVIDNTWALSYSKGLKAGLIGGVLTCCVGVVIYKHIRERNPKMNG